MSVFGSYFIYLFFSFLMGVLFDICFTAYFPSGHTISIIISASLCLEEFKRGSCARVISFNWQCVGCFSSKDCWNWRQWITQGPGAFFRHLLFHFGVIGGLGSQCVLDVKNPRASLFMSSWNTSEMGGFLLHGLQVCEEQSIPSLLKTVFMLALQNKNKSKAGGCFVLFCFLSNACVNKKTIKWNGKRGSRGFKEHRMTWQPNKTRTTRI